jgi:hypothetical protein
MQQDLRETMRKVRFVHSALLSESLVYLLVALLLKKFSGFTGFAPSRSSDIDPVLGMQILLILLIPILALGLAAIRGLVMSKEFLAPPGVSVEQLFSRYTRRQIFIDALAGAPALVGFVLFLLDATSPLLIVFVLDSMLLLALLFPRERHLTAVLGQIKGGPIAAT